MSENLLRSRELASQLNQDDFDYEIRREGDHTTHVNSYDNTSVPAKKNKSTGIYIKLESPLSLEVLHTKTFADGPMAGYQTVTIKPEIPFPFLKLPREIRDEIYAYAMVREILPQELLEHLGCEDLEGNDGVIRFRRLRPGPAKKDRLRKLCQPSKESSEYQEEYVSRKRSLTPGLLVTSRQVYRESLPILYGANVFEMDPKYQMPSILTQFGNSSGYLRSLCLTDGFWEMTNIGKYLEPLVHLRQLSVGMPWGTRVQIQGPAHLADIFFDKLYRWIRGVALVHGDETRAADYVTINCDRSCLFRCNGRLYGATEECLMMEPIRSGLKAAILARTSLPFPFMKLPRQVRDMIYSHAMTYKPFPNLEEEPFDSVHISLDRRSNPVRILLDWNSSKLKPNGWRSGGFRWSESLTPGLLRINRQIHQEAVQILYGRNKFDLEDPEEANVWLNRIGHSQIYLRDVYIGFLPNDRTIFDKLLHVDRLEICIAHAYDYDEVTGELYEDGEVISKSPEEAAEAFFASGGHWIEGAGNFRGGRAAAIDRIHPWGTFDDDEEESWVRRFREELKSICG
ncbi:hypothetical protein SLS58_004976 [Diplodia intermedia]|uniref:DUF7730 domain-containing protein n=1 Tax=Diplodia intermedia TaxID=856260 RepID=A0ABR3TS55_9PEZI